MKKNTKNSLPKLIILTFILTIYGCFSAEEIVKTSIPTITTSNVTSIL